MADLHPVAHAVGTSRSRRPSIATGSHGRELVRGSVPPLRARCGAVGTLHNLKNVGVDIPLGVLTVFTGTPADLVATGDSLTARHLRAYLQEG
jgi:hypothetical protein